ncbi:T7SS effector LXG polymorphic toxin [Ligilactobacillus hohenheimensis]|uniref:T7SS effector LXG polymorphic toxin n=1 Tax=Ligilactobacillus hohenheimensis TaxID=2991832 RepID=UPI0024BBEB28|nr:T7SS effector LXG polymorphic toxin [Ligilactobacillus hohenheimensis]
MGKRFDLSASRTQASSCQQSCAELGSSIQQISTAVNQAASSDIGGMGGTHVKEYAEAVVVPMLQAAVMLSDAVKQGTTKLPQQYVAKVDSKSHSEDELREEINNAKTEVSMLSDMEKVLSAVSKSLGGVPLNAVKGAHADAQSRLQKAEQILQKFMGYDGESASFFDDVEGLWEAFAQGANVMQSGVISNGEGFIIPEDLEWAEYISDRWGKSIKNHRDEIEDKADDVISLLAGLGKDVAKKGKVFHARELYRVADKGGKGADIFQYITSAFDFRRDFKKTHDFGVSLMKDFGGVGASAVAVKVFSDFSDPAVAVIGTIAGDSYSLLYKHFPPFRHVMNDIGHAVDVLGKEIEAEPKEAKKELHEEHQVTNRMSPKLDSGTMHDIEEEKQINNDMARGFN